MEIPYQIHVHHDKKFKDYLFDFFMLFFAVTLGFIVENTRENFSKKKKEKEYMRSMIQDLKEDTLKINAALSYNSYLLMGVDTLINFIYQYNPKDSEMVKNLYQKYIMYGRNNYVVLFTDRTLIQLKSSGAFSSLANGVSDSILKYEGTINNAILSENIYKDNFTKSLDLSSSIFDYRYIRYNVNILDKYYNSYQPQHGYKLLINDTMILSRYANILELFKQVILGYVWQLQGVKSTAKSLIPFLKKEYRLK